MAIFISFGIFKNFRKKEVVRKGHEAPTRVEAPPTGRAPCLVSTSCASRTPFSCTLRILVGKNSLYILPKVLTLVSRKYPLFSFRAVSVADLERHGFTLLQQWRQRCLAFEDRAEKIRTRRDQQGWRDQERHGGPTSGGERRRYPSTFT